MTHFLTLCRYAHHHRPNCLNILISSSPLIKTLSKVMLFKLSPYFAVNNIYSYTKSSKLTTVFMRFNFLH